MFNVDRCADADLSIVARWQHGIGGGPFHQADHVRRGINRRQGLVVGVEGVTMLHGLRRLSAKADRNLFCHIENLPNPRPATKSSVAFLGPEWRCVPDVWRKKHLWVRSRYDDLNSGGNHEAVHALDHTSSIDGPSSG